MPGGRPAFEFTDEQIPLWLSSYGSASGLRGVDLNTDINPIRVETE